MKFPRIKKIGRYAVCGLLLAAFFLLFEAQLFQWQIVRGETYQEQSMDNRTDTIELEASRGQLLDRNGNVLAGNKISYSIIYNALDMVYEERNATILKVLDLLEEREEKWRDRLPILLDGEGNYQFAEDRENSIAGLKEFLNLADYATADECVAELSQLYHCEGFTKEDTRNVVSVRYSMYLDGFSRTNPYVIARDVSAQTVGVVDQRAGELKGIEARVDSSRYYGEEGDLAPHVVGFTGAISEDQYNAAKENGEAYDYAENISGYKWTDTRGQSGLESAFEKDLRGQRGQETIFNDDSGEVKGKTVTVQPQQGNTVYTTLDSDLQRAANISLEKNILANTKAKDCIAGAAVVLDVKDFGVLACSSYPTYDMNLYTTDESYTEKMTNDKVYQPLYNRALDGVYVPGSVFKPMVALAALQEGVITAGTTYFCEKLYTLGDDPLTALKLKCTDYHGNTNVYSALAGSCNVFFCNVGLDLTIKKMDAYAQYFGLGEITGVELGESQGTMSNPQEFKINHPGEEWLDGMSAQTAIGQADNRFTPIQLAAYCATIANGGKRLQTHFLQKVTDYAGEETVRRYEPKELFDAGLSDDVLGIVKQGMLDVAGYGTASDVFGDYPVAIACKTGTGENSDDDSIEPNISFICYAPADDPEIAVAVMLERGNKGNFAQNVAKDILDEYFGYYHWDEDKNRYDADGNLVDDSGKVLKTKEQLDKEKEEQEEREHQDFLSSALEDTSGVSSQPEPMGSASPEPASSEGSVRDDIPDAPFTGSSAPESLPAPDGSAAPGVSPSPTVEPKKQSPYYSESGADSGG